MAKDESKIYGQHACRALFEERPGCIIRVVLTEECSRKFRELIKFCVEKKKSYRVVEAEELEKFSGARHHEGICILAKDRYQPPAAKIFAEEGNGMILALDEVSNPHNLGTLLRTAAHFGAKAVVVGGKLRKISGAVYRTSEGAAEKIPVLFTDSLPALVGEAKEAGYEVCATSSHKGESLYGNMPKRCLLLLGAERDGLSAKLFDSAGTLLSIPGTGSVESLNVAASAAVFLAEYNRSAA